jgi:hypothetical protein
MRCFETIHNRRQEHFPEGLKIEYQKDDLKTLWKIGRNKTLENEKRAMPSSCCNTELSELEREESVVLGRAGSRQQISSEPVNIWTGISTHAKHRTHNHEKHA